MNPFFNTEELKVYGQKALNLAAELFGVTESFISITLHIRCN